MRKLMPSTKQYPVSTNSNTFAVTSDAAKTGSSPSHKVFAAIVGLGFLVFTGCGGGYQNARPSTKPPYQKSLAQVQVTAIAGRSIQISGTVLVSASAVYQNSPTSFASMDVTNSAAWTTSDAAIATVNNGVVTGTGTGSVTISAAYGGKSGSMTVFVGLTNYITISPTGPFRLSSSGISFYATETFPDGSTLDVSGPATWNSSSGVLNIYPYADGWADIVAAGTTTVTATLDTGEVGSMDVTVVP
jgi:hypothetical protein